MQSLGEISRVLLKVLMVLVVALGPLVAVGVARSEGLEAFPNPENLDSVLAQMFPPELLSPPYRIELWVSNSLGTGRRETQALLEDCLKRELKGLGEVEPVDFLSSEKATLRLRVWYSQAEGPDSGECFDTTLAVVVGKINREIPTSEIVLDAFSIAGISSRELDRMCEKIVLRLDLKILSILRNIRSSAHHK